MHANNSYRSETYSAVFSICLEIYSFVYLGRSIPKSEASIKLQERVFYIPKLTPHAVARCKESEFYNTAKNMPIC